VRTRGTRGIGVRQRFRFLPEAPSRRMRRRKGSKGSVPPICPQFPPHSPHVDSSVFWSMSWSSCSRPYRTIAGEAIGSGASSRAAADDDPSGMTSILQAGAQFGTHYGPFCSPYPLMVSIQMSQCSPRLHHGRGLAANVKSVFPRSCCYGIVGSAG